jgi:hypothetical protein
MGFSGSDDLSSHPYHSHALQHPLRDTFTSNSMSKANLNPPQTMMHVASTRASAAIDGD